MNIQRKIRVAAPVAKAWSVIGPSFADVDQWASNVFISKAHHKTGPSGAPSSGRVCETSQGTFDESIIGYDEDRHTIAYAVTGKSVPGFVRSIRASWDLQAAGPSATNVTMTMNADLSQPFGFLMGWMMKMQFGKAIDESLEEFQHYLEKGRVHPRKTKADQSKQAKKARAAA